jgi:hypothetical protein
MYFPMYIQAKHMSDIEILADEHEATTILTKLNANCVSLHAPTPTFDFVFQVSDKETTRC